MTPEDFERLVTSYGQHRANWSPGTAAAFDKAMSAIRSVFAERDAAEKESHRLRMADVVRERSKEQLLAERDALQARLEAAERKAIRMTGYQISHVWDFIDGEMEADISIGYGDEFTDECGVTPAGLRAWFTEYPEEGSVHLYETKEENQAAIDAAQQESET